MTPAKPPLLIRVTHRFDASAERVYDAFLDPSKASRFLFATGTGQVTRCELDARVGGAFTIVDRRHGEDVLHTGKYLELERPRRLVFTFAVPKYSPDSDRVTLDLVPRGRGCELTLTHEMGAEHAQWQESTRKGWSDILGLAAELLVDDAPTCGIGVAQHAAIPAKLATMFEGLAETFALHRRMLKREDAASKQEDDVYRELAETWSDLAKRVAHAASRMAEQRDLPMGAHDESAWGPEHHQAFEKFVRGQSDLLALLRVAAERDEKVLASMSSAG